MKSATIMIRTIEDAKKLCDIAGHCPFAVTEMSEGNDLDMASLISVLSMDLTGPVTISYDGENAKLEEFVEAHKGK